MIFMTSCRRVPIHNYWNNYTSFTLELDHAGVLFVTNGLVQTPGLEAMPTAVKDRFRQFVFMYCKVPVLDVFTIANSIGVNDN